MVTMCPQLLGSIINTVFDVCIRGPLRYKIASGGAELARYRGAISNVSGWQSA